MSTLSERIDEITDDILYQLSETTSMMWFHESFIQLYNTYQDILIYKEEGSLLDNKINNYYKCNDLPYKLPHNYYLFAETMLDDLKTHGKFSPGEYLLDVEDFIISSGGEMVLKSEGLDALYY